MTSMDNQQYLSVELFNAHMSRLEALLEKHSAQTQAQIADLRSELKQEIGNVHSELKQDISNLRSELYDTKTELKQDISNLRSELYNTKIELKSEIAEVCADMKVQNARIDDLFHWNYWVIAFIVALFMLPSVIDGTKAFFKSLTDGVISLFSRKKNEG